MLGSVALKRDQYELWSPNPMYGMYTVKFYGDIKGEALREEDEDADAEMNRVDEEMETEANRLNNQPPTPPTDSDEEQASTDSDDEQ